MVETSKIRLGISIGDPNGIGFEIILKTFEDKKIFDLLIPIVFANVENFIEQRQRLGIKTNIFSLKNIHKPEEGKLNIINTWNQPFPIIFGEVQKEAGKASISSLAFVLLISPLLIEANKGTSLHISCSRFLLIRTLRYSICLSVAI